MIKSVIKRNGDVVPYDVNKIINAIDKAFIEVTGKKCIGLVEKVIDSLKSYPFEEISVEDIQDYIEFRMMSDGYYDIAKAYIRYRYKREMARHQKLENSLKELIDGTSEYWNTENSNKNPQLVTTQRDYIAGIVSTEMTKNNLVDGDILDAHNKGIIHFHDMDYMFQRSLHNCDLVNLEDMLQNGTVISGTMIEKPHSFPTACNIATQIIAQVASSQYGGQTISLSHLAPFVEVSRQNIRKELERDFGEANLSEEIFNKILEKRVRQEIKRGVQTIQYQVVTLMTTNGQAPFISVMMYLNEVKDEQTKNDLALIIEEVLNQRIKGVKNEKGVWITPAFPKLLYVLQEDNIRPDGKYYYLTEIAARCTAKRLVPDYISEKIMLENKIDKNGDGNCYPCMGCRSFLTPFVDEDGKPKYYGRFNQGVVTLNLADVALSSNGDFNKFWDIMNERLDICHRALQIRHKKLEGTPSDVAPILWQHGALARLEKGETIDKLLHGGYSTLSLGYAGLYECVKYMTGCSHTGDGKDFGLQVMQSLNDACKKWKSEENIDYSVYGTPIESTTYKFAQKMQERFGVIEGITDRNYITNSYHVPVFEVINPFDKLLLESEFQKLSPGGAISYIEVANLQNNIPAVLKVIQFIYDHIMYAELNTKSDYCHECGYDGEILIDDNMEWYCPNCGNRDTSRMNVARRTCGYISSNFFNFGRTQEIKERVVHLDNHEVRL